MWGRTITFPMVPVAVTMLHTSGKLLAWAANSTNASPAGTGYASMAADVIGLTVSPQCPAVSGLPASAAGTSVAACVPCMHVPTGQLRMLD